MSAKELLAVKCIECGEIAEPPEPLRDEPARDFINNFVVNDSCRGFISFTERDVTE